MAYQLKFRRLAIINTCIECIIDQVLRNALKHVQANQNVVDVVMNIRLKMPRPC